MLLNIYNPFFDMKKICLLLLSSLLYFGCTKNDDCPVKTPDKDLVSPELYARLVSRTPLNGTLDVFPCEENSSTFYGNYFDNTLTDLGGYYNVSNGYAVDGSNPIVLPIGTYNMVYWGITDAPVTSSTPYPITPAVDINRNLADYYYTLRPNSDNTFYPARDLVHATGEVKIGTDELTAELERAVAGFNVILKNENSEKFNESIKNVNVHIGGIAEGLNFYTAKPNDKNITISFPMTISPDSTEINHTTVMLFPSVATPQLKIFIYLKNGAVKTYQQALDTPFVANNKLTLTLTLNEIFSEESTTGSFTVSNWNLENETIDLPPIN